jgi:hypothetical protein
MQIKPNQVVTPETRVDDTSPLVEALKAAGAKEPKIVLVFDSNKGAADAAENPWKVRVFYHSSMPLTEVDLSVKTLLMDTKIMPEDDEVMRTIYPDKYVGWCGVINGQAIWIT